MILYGCVISTLLLRGGNADSIRLPVSGELVYDSTSKMARVCLFPKMCPPCVLERVCHLGNHPSPSPHSTESSTTSTPSTTSSSTEATSTSSGSLMTTEEALTSSTSSTPTPSSGTSDTTTSPSTESTTGTSETWSSTNPTSSATTVTSTVGGGEGEEFQQAGLRAHNDFRKTHKSPPLSLSSELNSDAQATADRIARQGKLQHTSQSELDDQGENLGKMCTYGETAEEIVPRVVTYWYYEVCDYNFNKPGWSSSTGHFTQLVWASTEELGLGVTAKDEDGATCYYVVGRYYPSGNVDNEYEENVKKGNFDPSLCSTKKRNLHRTNQVMDFIKRKWQHFVHKISE